MKWGSRCHGCLAIKISYHTSALHSHIFLNRFDKLSPLRISFLDLAMGTLCQYCKVLEIDDAASGAFRDESIPGKNVAAFSGGYTLEDFQRQTCEFLEEYPGSHRPVKMWMLTIDYDRRDTFPELPGLKESAAECAFCALLRTWIQWHFVKATIRFNDPEQTITIRSFVYRWYGAIGKDGIPFKKLHHLTPYIYYDFSDSSYFQGAPIRIDAPNGKRVSIGSKQLGIDAKHQGHVPHG